MRQLSAHLFAITEACNVYLIRAGSRALVIDCGSGRWLPQAKRAGIEKVEWLLHTHHHRDQCSGDEKLLAQGAKLAVPAGERQLFEDASGFWQKKRIYVMYDTSGLFNTRRESVPVAASLSPDHPFTWRGYRFEVIPVPGHTRGSIALRTQVDGKWVLFSGDLISAPAKCLTFFDLQWFYGPGPGSLPTAIESVRRVAALDVDLLLPAHGEPIAGPRRALEALATKTGRMIPLTSPERNPLKRTPLLQVTPHLWYLGATSYLMVSDRGRGFMVDYGYVSDDLIGRAKRELGLKHLDVITITHYHDDHVARISDLQYRAGTAPVGDCFIETEVWAHECLVDILERPQCYNLPCLFPSRIDVQRVLRQETFTWEGFRFHSFHMPGQTYYHAGLLVEVDGRRIAFTGDSVWNTAQEPLQGPVIPANQFFQRASYIPSIRRLIALEPDLLLPSHYDPIPVDRARLERFLSWAEELNEALADLIGQDEPEYGTDCRRVHFYPYRSIVRPGEVVELQVRIRNHYDKAQPARIRLVGPKGWRFAPGSRELQLPPKTEVAADFAVQVPRRVQLGRRFPLSADVHFARRYHGEVAEALIETEVPEYPPAALV